MSADDDTSDGERENDGPAEPDDPGVETDDTSDVRERLEQEADRALEQFDEGLIDLLAWILDTETKARIYVHLCQQPHCTSDEIAEGTGLYPSTVREALASLHEEGTVTRQKRQNDGAGNNPYEYSAIQPSELVSDIVDDVQNQLNTVFNLDRYLDSDEDTETEPVTITVTDESDDPTADETTASGTADDSAASEDAGSDDTASEDGDTDDE